MTSTATDVSTNTELLTARHLINGEWLGEADTERMNPARPGELAGLYPAAPDHVDATIVGLSPPCSRPGQPCPHRPRRHPYHRGATF